MVWRMSIDKEKVNQILLEFQQILKEYRPNTSELQLINKKITQMTVRNVNKTVSKGYPNQKQVSEERKTPQSPKKWHKIKVE